MEASTGITEAGALSAATATHKRKAEPSPAQALEGAGGTGPVVTERQEVQERHSPTAKRPKQPALDDADLDAAVAELLDSPIIELQPPCAAQPPAPTSGKLSALPAAQAPPAPTNNKLSAPPASQPSALTCGELSAPPVSQSSAPTCGKLLAPLVTQPHAPTCDEFPATQPLEATQPLGEEVQKEEQAQDEPAASAPVPARSADVVPLQPAPTASAAQPAPTAPAASKPASVCFPGGSPALQAVASNGGSDVSRCSPTPPKPSFYTFDQEDSACLELVLPRTDLAAAAGTDAEGRPGAMALGGYLLFCDKASALGSGGLGSVHLGHHVASGAEVAVKLGRDFVEEEGRHDFTWWSFVNEWNVYAALGAGPHSFCACTYEMGLVRTETGVAPWIRHVPMEVLGADLHNLNRRRRITPANLPQYGAAALAALEALHRAGYVHADVKPANFCTRRPAPSSSCGGSSDGTATSAASSGAAASPPQVVLVDFGFAMPWSPTTAGGRWSFVGTPDFASIASLRGSSPAPRDDVEALGYCLLELALGDLPWDVTRRCAAQGSGSHDTCSWSTAQLERMATTREGIWREGVASGGVPGWIVDWVETSRRLSPACLPDYCFYRNLLANAAQAVQEAEAAKAAAAADAAHLMGAEE